MAKGILPILECCGGTVPSGIGAIKPFHAFMDARAENGAPLRYGDKEAGKASNLPVEAHEGFRVGCVTAALLLA
jgi:hypothetical protein